MIRNRLVFKVQRFTASLDALDAAIAYLPRKARASQAALNRLGRLGMRLDDLTLLAHGGPQPLNKENAAL